MSVGSWSATLCDLADETKGELSPSKSEFHYIIHLVAKMSPKISKPKKFCHEDVKSLCEHLEEGSKNEVTLTRKDLLELFLWMGDLAQDGLDSSDSD